MNEESKPVGAAACRWTGRIVGSMLLMMTLLIAFGEGLPNPFTQPVAVQVGFLALALILLGILAGWRWELAGGAVSLCGWCLFVVSVIDWHRGPNLFVTLLALPGLLYLASALWRLRMKHPKRI